MAKRLLFCEVCGRMTEHVVEGGDDECGEMALCTRCGRLSSLPVEGSGPHPRPPRIDPRAR